MKRGIGQSLLFRLIGQRLAVIRSAVAFFPLLFLKSTPQQGVGHGYGGRSRPRDKQGPWQRWQRQQQRLAGVGWPAAATSPALLVCPIQLMLSHVVCSLLTCMHKNGSDSEINSQQFFHEV